MPPSISPTICPAPLPNQAGQWTALALGVAGGVAAFTLRALREGAMAEKAQVGQ